jgi:hypothetical protein
MNQIEKHIQVADHMMTITYPMVKDSKLLLNILDNIGKAMLAAIDQFLAKERMAKRIPPYGSTTQAKLLALHKHAKTYGIQQKDISMLQEILSILEKREKAPIEFRRKEQFVICSETYDIDMLSEKKVKAILQQAKRFIYQLNHDNRR